MEIQIIMFVMGKRKYIADGIFIIYFQRHAGGTNAISNLICTNIATNDEAADKIIFLD